MSDFVSDFLSGLGAVGSAAVATAPLWLTLLLALGPSLGLGVQSLRAAGIIRF